MKHWIFGVVAAAGFVAGMGAPVQAQRQMRPGDEYVGMAVPRDRVCKPAKEQSEAGAKARFMRGEFNESEFNEALAEIQRIYLACLAD